MRPDATTIPLADEGVGRLRAGGGAGGWGARARSALSERAGAQAWLGPLCLGAIVAGSLLVVLMAANRPSLLAPTSHTAFYPRWMAGPLGGLWPGLTDNGTTLKYLFSGAIVLMYLAYVSLLRWGGSLSTRWVVAGIVAVHAIFVLSPPLALTDVFNYINYGRMEVVHHLNPYTTIPILEPHDDPSFVLSNWHQLLSPYGPMFTLLTFAVVGLGVAGSFWALKALLALASLATIYLVWRCALLLGRDPRKAAVFVGLNPIVLVWGLGGDHNDFLMLACIVGGFYLLLLARSRRTGGADWGASAWPHVGAGAAFVAAVALKASAAVLIPVVLAALVRDRRTLAQMVAGMIGGGIVLGTLSVIAFGLHIPDLSTQSKLVTSESIPNLIGLAVGAGGETDALHKLTSALLLVSVALCCAMAWRAARHAQEGADPGERVIAASGWASVALLVTLSWVLPWYVLWVLPLAALSASVRLRRVALVLGVYLIVAWAPVSGLLWNAIGFHPEKTSLGRLHQRYVRELLN